MPNVNSFMLALAREARGHSQTSLAKAVGTTQSTISKYEAGASNVSDEHLASLCRVLRFDRSFFEQQDLAVGLGGDFLYRKKARLSAKARQRIEAEANVRKLQVSRLMRGASFVDPLMFPTVPLEDVNYKPEQAARETRAALRLRSGPIPNLTRVIEGAGAIVFTLEFGTHNIDGTNMRLAGLPPLLFLNRNVPGERHRFNLAHELGHAVMHFSTALIGDPEDQANAFAQELLMPRKEVRSDLHNLDLKGALRLKKFWGVSMQAVIKRAYDLRVISESKYRRLFTQLGSQGMRTQEPEPLAFEEPETFDRLVAFHREQLGYSDDDLYRLLFTDKLGELDEATQPKLRLVGNDLFDQAM